MTSANVADPELKRLREIVSRHKQAKEDNQGKSISSDSADSDKMEFIISVAHHDLCQVLGMTVELAFPDQRYQPTLGPYFPVGSISGQLEMLSGNSVTLEAGDNQTHIDLDQLIQGLWPDRRKDQPYDPAEQAKRELCFVGAVQELMETSEAPTGVPADGT